MIDADGWGRYRVDRSCASLASLGETRLSGEREDMPMSGEGGRISRLLSVVCEGAIGGCVGCGCDC